MFDMVPGFIVKIIAMAAARWRWLGIRLSRYAINRSVSAARNRPHPWSTVHDYVSWRSLSDQHYSARHLPADHRPRPSTEAVKALFERPAGRQVLDDKSTCLFPAFAQYLTDGFIRTRMPDKSRHQPEDLRLQNTSNHQIDLCPLYGLTPAHTELLRDTNPDPARRGRLRSQMIGGEEFAPFLFDSANAREPKAEFKDLDLPLGLEKFAPVGSVQRGHLFAFGGDRANAVPQVAMLNTVLLREHNRLAGELARRHPDWDDTRVFETARNILIVIVIKIVVEDYMNHISPAPFRLIFDATIAPTAVWNRANWITTEFSLLYRWHSLLPDTLQIGAKSVPVGDLFFNNRLLIERGVLDLAADLSAQRAGRIGPFNTAQALIPFETAAIDQDARVALAPYVDYRRYASLPRPGRFDEISSDPAVQKLLEEVYGTPDKVDFYAGLFAEDLEKNSPLPPLMISLVALDAFSQALTNPLLSEHVFNVGTFTQYGLDELERTGGLKDLIARNVSGDAATKFISLTQKSWTYAW